MWNEFKSFAFKGNAFDLAIGVIIGAAFSRIVDGIVNLLIMPIIGAVTGGLNFDNYFLPLAPGITATNLVEAQKQGAVLGYGAFHHRRRQLPDRGLRVVPAGQGRQPLQEGGTAAAARRPHQDGGVAGRNPRCAEDTLERVARMT